MNRLFRQPNAGFRSYAALAVFVAAYLAVLGLVLSPALLLPATGALP
jgi:hypothetical protein